MYELILYKCHADGCDNQFEPFRSTDKYCSYGCAKRSQKPGKPKKMTQIRRFGIKRMAQERQYLKDRVTFLSKKENRKCPVTGGRTTDVHHKKGRIGSLLLDQRFWLAVSADGHKKIELNPTWAKEKGYSLNRI